jgi:hypothetical protein
MPPPPWWDARNPDTWCKPARRESWTTARLNSCHWRSTPQVGFAPPKKAAEGQVLTRLLRTLRGR